MWTCVLWVGCQSRVDLPTASADRGEVHETRSLQGQLQAAEAHRIVAPWVWGLTISWLEEEGKRVEEGDLVLTLDAKRYEDEVVEYRSRLEVLQAKIGQQDDQRVLARQSATRRLEESELERHLAGLKTSESEAVPMVERERAKVDLAMAELDVKGARSGIAMVEQSGASEVDLLILEARDLQGRIAELERTIESCNLKAPGPGIIVYGTSHRRGTVGVGERVWAGQLLIELPNLASLQVEGWLHEVDSPGVEEGQQAEIRMDAHAGESFPATIHLVAPIAVPRGEHGIKHVRVLLDVDEPDPRMKPGMTVSIDLSVRSVDDAVRVPAEAVMLHEGQRVVWVDDGDWTPHPIEILATGEDHIAVEGIEEGATVALADPGGAR